MGGKPHSGNTRRPIEEDAPIADHSIQPVLDEEEKAFLDALYQQPQRSRWRCVSYWLLLLTGAALMALLGFWQSSVSIDLYSTTKGQIRYAQKPPAAIFKASQQLPAGSLVTHFDGQWLACQPQQEGWQCREIATP